MAGRAWIAATLALAVFGGLCESTLGYRFNEPSVRQAGAEEVVFDWGNNNTAAPTGARPRCAEDDIPDAAARAYRDASGNLVLISSHFATRRFIGTGSGAASFGLGNLTHPCAVVMPSGLNMNASAFDDHEWLSSPFTTDGSNVYALVHEEYQGWRTGYGHSCTGDFSQQQKCWRNSVTLATSTNGGASFSSPGNVVAVSPYPFVSGIGPYGYFKPSSIVRHSDGMYYAMVRSIGTSSTPAQAEGVCVMRTGNLADAASWRAWDGDGFDVSFVKPYPTAPDPASHVCQAVDPDLFRMTSTLVYSEYLGKYLVIDLLNGQGSYNPPGARVPGIYFSTSEDLVSWTPPKLLMEAEIAETHTCGDDDPVRVPSLIDHSRTERNFDRIGSRPYLYFTRSNMFYNEDGSCFLDLDRDLVRIPIEFAKPAEPTLTNTSPASPANNNAPFVRGTAASGTTVRLFTNSGCTGNPAATAAATTFSTSGIQVSVANNSSTTFHATATDAAGNASDCSTSSVTYVEDSTAPGAPTLTSTSPASPANNNAPRVRGTAAAESIVKLYTNPTCSGTPAASAEAATFATSGIEATVADDSTTTFRATATDQAGNASPCSTSSVSYVEDSSLLGEPVFTSTDPPSPANDNTPRVKGTAPAGTTVRLYANPTCTGSPLDVRAAATFATAGMQPAVADNSTTTFHATATNPQTTTVSGCSVSSITYVEDSIAPPAPTVTLTDPPSPADHNTPRVRGSAAAGTTVRIFKDAACSGTAHASGPASTFAAPGVLASVPDNSATAFYATAVDQAGNSSPCSTNPVIYMESSPGGTPTPPLADASGLMPSASPLGTPVLPDTVAPRVAVASKVVRMTARGGLRIRLSCPSSEPGGCSGVVRLRTRGRVRINANARRRLELARRNFNLDGGETTSVRVRLGSRSRRVVNKLRRVSVVAIVEARDQAGNARTVQRSLRLEARRKRAF